MGTLCFSMGPAPWLCGGISWDLAMKATTKGAWGDMKMILNIEFWYSHGQYADVWITLNNNFVEMWVRLCAPASVKKLNTTSPCPASDGFQPQQDGVSSVFHPCEEGQAGLRAMKSCCCSVVGQIPKIAYFRFGTCSYSRVLWDDDLIEHLHVFPSAIKVSDEICAEEWRGFYGSICLTCWGIWCRMDW